MHFLHGYLLIGAVMAGMPVILHLLMKQKPKIQSFPALRFLQKRMQNSRRRLQIQNWLLLLLRIFLILLLCLALAWPQLTNLGEGWGISREVAALFVVDTSASMQVRVGEKNRIDVAKAVIEQVRARFGSESKLALADTDEGGETVWLSAPIFEQKLSTLGGKPSGGPLGPAIARSLELFRKEGQIAGLGKAIYILTDRAERSWEGLEASIPKDAIPPGVQVHLIDVGPDKTIDAAIDRVEIEPTTVSPGSRISVRVEVHATGEAFKGQLSCQLENDPEPRVKPEIKSIEIPANESKVIVFDRTVPVRPGGASGEFLGQIKVLLSPDDNWSSNNQGQATFLVRERRQVLTLADRPEDARIWKAALEAMGTYSCDVKSLADPANWSVDALLPYQVICLMEPPNPSAAVWVGLLEAAKSGKGIVVVPPGDNYSKPAWESAPAKGLLPATLGSLITVEVNKPGIPWAEFRGDSSLTSAFRTWSRSVDPDFSRPELKPFANRFWKTATLEPGASVVARFLDGQDPQAPALLERTVGKGRVVLFSTPMSGKRFDGKRPWHNYWQDSSFGLILADRVCAYLGGDATAAITSFYAGQIPYINLPNPLPKLPLTLAGPGLKGAEANLSVPEGATQIPCAQVRDPGNYRVLDKNQNPIAGFSISMRPQEFQLAKIDPEVIKRTLPQAELTNGLKPVDPDLLLPPGEGGTLDLLPWLMMLVLVLLLCEGLVANRFHKKVDPNHEGAGVGPAPASQTT